jgi:small-conductance mechanosensitive channel
LAGRDEILKQRATLVKEQSDLNAQKPTAANVEEQKEQEQLQVLREKKGKLEEAIEGHRIRISQIEEFRTRAKLLRDDLESFNAELKRKLKDFGLEDQDSALQFSIPTGFDDILKNRISAIEKTIQSLEGIESAQQETVAPPTLSTDTLVSIEKQITEIETKSKLEAQRKRKLIEFGKRISDII